MRSCAALMVRPRGVRDLIEAGLSELDDAVVAMDLVVVGSMQGVIAQGLARSAYPIFATWAVLQRVALLFVLTGYSSRYGCPGDS